MSLIKDLVDLATQLNNSVTDRKTRELLLPLREKTLAVQQEQLRIEQRHADAMAELKNEHTKAIAVLESENAELRATIKKLESRDNQPAIDATQSRILTQLHPDSGTSVTQIAKQCGISEKQSLHYLLTLRNDDLVYSSNYSDDPDWDTGCTTYETTWIICQPGLEYLANNGLLN